MFWRHRISYCDFSLLFAYANHVHIKNTTVIAIHFWSFLNLDYWVKKVPYSIFLLEDLKRLPSTISDKGLSYVLKIQMQYYYYNWMVIGKYSRILLILVLWWWLNCQCSLVEEASQNLIFVFMCHDTVAYLWIIRTCLTGDLPYFLLESGPPGSNIMLKPILLLLLFLLELWNDIVCYFVIRIHKFSPVGLLTCKSPLFSFIWFCFTDTLMLVAQVAYCYRCLNGSPFLI